MNEDDVRHEDVRQEIVQVRRIFEEQKAVQESKAAEQAAQTQELMRMMTELLGKKERGGQTQEVSATGDEERDPPALPTPREDPLSTGEGAVSVEVGSRGDQPGESGQDRDYGLTGESTSTRDVRQQYMGMPKMVPPILKERGGFPEFREQVMVYAKYYRFDKVFTSDPNVDVGSKDRDTLLRQGVSEAMYERQLRAYGFLSQAFQIKTDIGRFRRSNSPGECWGETRKWYGARTVGQQIELRKKLTSFNIAKGSDPVEKFLEIEDVCEAMRDAGMDVDDQTVYGIYVAALPSEYDLEIRELSRKQFLIVRR